MAEGFAYVPTASASSSTVLDRVGRVQGAIFLDMPMDVSIVAARQGMQRPPGTRLNGKKVGLCCNVTSTIGKGAQAGQGYAPRDGSVR